MSHKFCSHSGECMEREGDWIGRKQGRDLGLTRFVVVVVGHGKRGNLVRYMTSDGFGSYKARVINGECMGREAVWVGNDKHGTESYIHGGH